MISNLPDMTALSERLNTVNFKVPEYDTLLRLMQRQFDSIAVRLDPDEPWGPGNRAPVRAIIVTGAHHSGISDLVAQCLEALVAVKAGDGTVIAPDPRIIDAPFVFNQASQARGIAGAIGYPMRRRMPADMAWERVFDRLDKTTVRPLVIDDWHWSFTPSHVGQSKIEAEKRKIQAAYVRLPQHPTAPLPLVLVGRSEALEHLKAKGMEKLPDHSDLLQLGRMLNDDAEHQRLRDGLEGLCAEAGLELSLHATDHPLQRLVHASDHVRGTAIVLCKLAVMQAVRQQASRLELSHLNAAYADSMNGALAAANPFTADDWSRVDTSKNTLGQSVVDTMRRMNRPNPKEKTDD